MQRWAAPLGGVGSLDLAAIVRLLQRRYRIPQRPSLTVSTHYQDEIQVTSQPPVFGKVNPHTHTHTHILLSLLFSSPLFLAKLNICSDTILVHSIPCLLKRIGISPPWSPFRWSLFPSPVAVGSHKRLVRSSVLRPLSGIKIRWAPKKS